MKLKKSYDNVFFHSVYNGYPNDENNETIAPIEPKMMGNMVVVMHQRKSLATTSFSDIVLIEVLAMACFVLFRKK